jgi:hypothetical protein
VYDGILLIFKYDVLLCAMTTVTNNLYGLEIRFCVDRVYLFYWLPCLKVTCNVCHGFAAIIHLNDMCRWEHIVDIHIQCIHFITMPQPLIIVKYTCKLILAWPRILIPLIGVLKIELWIFPLICGDIISALMNSAAASFETQWWKFLIIQKYIAQ